MGRMSRRDLILGMCTSLGPTFLAFKSCNCRHYRPRLIMPISLAEGIVRTPPFSVSHEGYQIIIRAERQRGLSLGEMNCMLGLSTGPLDGNNCDKKPLFEADWTVWDGLQLVAQGSVRGREGGAWAEDSIERYIGGFGGQSGRMYELEMRITKDVSGLNVTNPHLIVMAQTTPFCF